MARNKSKKWREAEVEQIVGFSWELQEPLLMALQTIQDKREWDDIKEHIISGQSAREAMDVIKRRGAEAAAYEDSKDETWRDEAITKVMSGGSHLSVFATEAINQMVDEKTFKGVVKLLTKAFGQSDEIAEEPIEASASGYLVAKQDFDYLPKTLVKEMPKHIVELPRIAPGSFQRLRNLKSLDAVRSLSKNFPHCEQVLQGVCTGIERTWHMGSNKIQLAPTILVGEAGVGKSAFARELAKTLDVYVREANVGGTPDAHIFGLSAGWSTAHAGIVTEAVASSETLNPMIIFNEIEKVHASKNGDIQAELLSLLEPTEARRYYERYLKTTVDASHVSWIFTANSLDTISEPLKSRCQIYEIPAPTIDQIPAIIHSLVAGYAADHGLRKEFFSLDIGETEMLVNTYERHKSVRTLNRLLQAYLHRKSMTMPMV